MMKRWAARLAGGLNEQERTFFPVDTARQAVDGIFDTLRNTVFLLVAVQFFRMSDTLNSFISMAPFVGMLLGIFITPLLEKRHTPGRILMALTLLMGIGLIFPLIVPGPLAYTAGVVLCGIISSLRLPFMTGMYNEFYRADRMARLMSVGTLIMILVATGSSWAFGQILDSDIGRYRWILLISGSFFAVNAFMLRRLPPSEEPVPERKEPFWSSLSLIWKEPRFGITSLSWMILGFANLWSAPIRTIYLSDPLRGLGLDPFTVLLILGIIPGFVRLISNFIWAHVYDKFSFIPVRMAMNILIGLGIFLFFISKNLIIITLGSVSLYAALAGAPFVWNLWVTRLAPPGEARKYMSVHTFLAGLRGIVGPPVAFAFIQNHDLQTVGFISTSLAVLAILALLPMFMKRFRF